MFVAKRLYRQLHDIRVIHAKGTDVKATQNHIDQIDDDILELLDQRFKLAAGLGEVKKERHIPIYDPEREGKILERLFGKVKANGKTKLSKEAVVAIWREIFSASRLAQTPIKVAYLGPEGTFTQQAVFTRFGSSVEMVAAQTISAAFAWIKNKTVDYAVLPVENALQGVVGQTVDLLGAAKMPLIVDETILPIHFVFASKQNELQKIERIYSKQEAFPQCSEFLGQPDLAQAANIPSTSTAEAARQAAADPAGAALCPDIAATLAGVPLRFKNVENDARNKTRFLVLGHNQPERTGCDRTSVFAKTPHVVGGLAALLQSFARRKLNMSKIESRPLDDAVNFECWFYIDFDGHREDSAVQEIIKEHDMVWLGSYPRRREMAKDESIKIAPGDK